jgi:hypothetical protein
LFFLIKFVNYRLHKFFDMAVRYDEALLEKKPATTDAQEDIEEEPKLLSARPTINATPSETQ